MRRWAVELKDRAFGVTLPEWASTRQRTVELVMSLRPGEGDFPLGGNGGGNGLSTPFEVATGRMALDSVLNFDWQVAVGDLELTPNEFQRLVEQHSPLVRHRGQWVEVDAIAADAAAKYLQEKQSGKMTLAEAFRAAFGLSRAPSDPAIRLSGSSWISQLLEQTPAMQMQELPQPDEFMGTLRPYQLRGLQWLTFLDKLGIGACLADDMGLGKTIQLIALLLRDHNGNSSMSVAGPENRPPTLLFAPTSVVGNWVKELQRFAPKLRVLLHHGPERPRGDGFIAAAEKHDLVITSYALAHRDLADLTRINWHRIALDEAQKIKNASSAASVAIRALTAPHRVALTGTPIENHLSELWSIMDMLNPGLLGSAREFRERFAVPIEKLADKQRSAHLRRMIRPFVLRRTKTDPELASDLPEKMEMKVYCNLTTEQAAMYERITAEMLGQIDEATGIRRRGLILAVLTRLKQLCNHPMLLTKDSGPIDGRSGKCERIADMLEEVLEEGESALVFTQYREMGHLLESLLQQRLNTPTLFLHGGTPQKRRDEMVQEFQTTGTDKKVFILSLRAGGLGLNLTAANHVFHFDRWWNPAVESQATDRAHRIGQNRKVQVHKFVAMGTVEERIDKMLTEKLQLADQIVGSGDEWLTNLSTSELREYLKLSEEAVGEF
jgi:SNF2 family DNA or RNA helicase